MTTEARKILPKKKEMVLRFKVGGEGHHAQNEGERGGRGDV